MDQSSNVGWLGPDCAWPSTEGSTVAVAGSLGENEAQPVSHVDQGCFSNAEDRSGGCATTAASQPSSGCGGRRSQRGSPTINPHAIPLKEALRDARAKSKVFPVGKRRGVQGVHRESQEASRAHEQKKVFETEVQEGEARLKELEAEAVSVPEPVTPVISDLQRQIDTLVRERDLLKAAVPPTRGEGVWMDDGPPVLEEIPPMPTTDVQEGWLSSRNCELRNALEFGDRATIARLGALVAQGSACFTGLMGGQDQSSLMSALIDKGASDGV